MGLIVAGGLVVSSILMGGAGAWFINYPSMMIVLGGTLGATLINYPLSDLVSVLPVTKNAFLYKTKTPPNLIRLIVNLSRKAKREGILSFEAQIKKLKDPFLVKGLQMAMDGMPAGDIEDVLSTEIYYLEERHQLGSEIFLTMGTFSPAIGMLGTIIGLVQMLMQMEDPSAIGAPMAVALLTTFYGTLLANLLFLPISGKLKARSRQEMFTKQMILEGILSLHAGDNYRVIEQKLKAFLSHKSDEEALNG